MSLEIKEICDAMGEYASKLMILYEMLRQNGTNFTGVTYGDTINGQRYVVKVELDDEEAEE